MENLLSVKSLVTLTLTAVFACMAAAGKVSQDFMTVYTVVIAFYFGARWYVRIKRENGGHAQFAFQKVVVPLSFLLVATAVFWLITK